MARDGLSGPLGAGSYRFFAYDRGGRRRIGELKAVSAYSWSRRRDEISEASVRLAPAAAGAKCQELLRRLRSFRHELVIFRSGVRVWEGPISRISDSGNAVDIDAKDVLLYMHRRIMRNGYNDSYPNIKSVVTRARILLEEGYALDDPNVAAYIEDRSAADDARQARIVLPYQKLVLEELDDLAARSGLDYTVIGRRIVLWDTHNPIGRLPRMTGADFLSRPVVTEYGMDLATRSAVTNGQGLYGVVGEIDPYYGLVEMLASAYSENDTPDGALGPSDGELATALLALNVARAEYEAYPGLSTAEDIALAEYEQERYSPGVLPDRQDELDLLIEPLRTRANEKAGLYTVLNRRENEYEALAESRLETAEALAAYIANLESQAERNLNGRNPAPLVVRVPDGSALSPSVELGINQLVPGIWMPLYVESAIRTVEQWQKLDAVSVRGDASGEQVGLTLSPAPGFGRDTDAEAQAVIDEQEQG